MTIKKRLFISNILMVVIPAAVSLIALLTFAIIFIIAVLNGGAFRITNATALYNARLSIEKAVESLICSDDESERLDSVNGLKNILDANSFVLSVLKNGYEVFRLGDSAIDSEDLLVSAAAALGGNGIVSNENSELYAKSFSDKGDSYLIYIFSPRLYELKQSSRLESLIFFLFILVLITAIIVSTNRFLTSFVFEKIEQPLKIISTGVHQIRDGNLEYRIKYYNDDEFKPVCDDLNDMAVKLKESVEIVQKNERTRKELLADISHDLRSPLTSIKAFVEGLIDGVANTPEARNNYLQIVKSKTDDINKMVSKLFLFSKLDMGNYPCCPEQLDIGMELSEFIAASQDDYFAKGLQIKTQNIPKNKYICADPTQLRSVFANILENSIKYGNREMVDALINCESSGGVIKITFDDNGPGVPAESLSKLFDVFYRSDPSRSNPQKGSGLGLAIVSKAIERMEGSIRAENLSPSGLRLIIEIPEVEQIEAMSLS